MFERLNLVLLVVVVASALGVVSAHHKARRLFTELERETQRAEDLETEYGQLQLEYSTWAAHGRIEKIARDTLKMRLPSEGKVYVLSGGRP